MVFMCEPSERPEDLHNCRAFPAALTGGNGGPQFGFMRIMPNSGRVPEASKRVTGRNAKPRSVVMPNWGAKTLISWHVGQAGQAALRPQYSALDSRRRCAARGEKRQKTGILRPRLKIATGGPMREWPTDYSLTKYERDLLSGPDGVGSLALSVRVLNCLTPPGITPRDWRILTIAQLCELTPRVLRHRHQEVSPAQLRRGRTCCAPASR